MKKSSIPLLSALVHKKIRRHAKRPLETETATVLQLRPNRTKIERLGWAKAPRVWASPSD